MRPEKLSEKLGEYFRKLDPAQLSLTAEAYIELPEEPERLGEREEVDAFLDRRVKRIRVVKRPLGVPTTKEVEKLDATEQVVTLDRYLDFARRSKDLSAIAGSSRMTMTESNWQSFLSRSFFGVLFGYLPLSGDHPEICSLLDELTIEVSESQLNSASLANIKGTSPQLLLEIALDPERQYMPQRIQFDRVGSGSRGISHYEYRVDETQEINGSHFPASFSIVTDFASKDENSEKTIRRRVTVNSATLAQPIDERDFDITTVVPNGFRIHMLDAAHLGFVWRDGKIVPGTNATILESASQASFSGRLQSPRTWIVILNVVVILGVLAWFYSTRSRRQS